GGADGAEDARYVDGDHLVPAGWVAVRHVAGDVDAGVGEEDVDAAEALEGGGDHGVDLLGTGEVGGEDEGLRPGRGGDGGEPVGRAGGEGEAGALAAEHPGERAADAGAGAGDERDLAPERRLHSSP